MKQKNPGASPGPSSFPARCISEHTPFRLFQRQTAAAPPFPLTKGKRTPEGCFLRQSRRGTDRQGRAAAGISTWDVGDSARNGFPGVNIENFFQKLLKEVADARIAEARGEEPRYWNYVPASADAIDENTSVIQREAYEYYRTPRCQYPTSVNKYLVSSNDKLAAFDAFAHIATVSPRPLLFIVGSRADTLYFTEDAYSRAKEPKEICTIEGATHVDLYDKPPFVEQVVARLTDFFGKALR